MDLIGIDGCRGGWVAARSQVNFGDLRFEVIETLGEVFDQARRGEACVAIDVPIGLNDGQPRVCDIEARKLLSRRHKSSIFPAPARCCLRASQPEDYLLACRLSRAAGGKSLSRQAHSILPKIDEVDQLIDADLQRRSVRETHPEVAFAALAGRGLRHSKKERDGEVERLELLERCGVVLDIDKIRVQLGRGNVTRDDIIDASVCLVTAQASQRGDLVVLPASPPQDARGLRMEIVMPPSVWRSRSSVPRINYDEIAHLYDEPARDHQIDERLLAFIKERPLEHARVLDIGCGTGKQLTANYHHLRNLTLIGLDRSVGMLLVAQRHCRAVNWLQADGCALPLRSGCIDYVCSQFAHAHIADKRELLREVHRVLAARGRFVLMNIDPWAMPDWILYRYFPEAQARDQADFVPHGTLLELLREAGFYRVEALRDHREEQVSVREFFAFASARWRASQFTAIPDAAYQSGLERLSKRVQQPDAETERSSFCLMTYIADK